MWELRPGPSRSRPLATIRPITPDSRRTARWATLGSARNIKVMRVCGCRFGSFGTSLAVCGQSLEVWSRSGRAGAL